MRKVYRCAWCLELNELLVDLSAGTNQMYTEDCEVCCRPNFIRVHIDEENRRVEVTSEQEG